MACALPVVLPYFVPLFVQSIFFAGLLSFCIWSHFSSWAIWVFFSHMLLVPFIQLHLTSPVFFEHLNLTRQSKHIQWTYTNSIFSHTTYSFSCLLTLSSLVLQFSFKIVRFPSLFYYFDFNPLLAQTLGFINYLCALFYSVHHHLSIIIAPSGYPLLYDPCWGKSLLNNSVSPFHSFLVRTLARDRLDCAVFNCCSSTASYYL